IVYATHSSSKPAPSVAAPVTTAAPTTTQRALVVVPTTSKPAPVATAPRTTVAPTTAAPTTDAPTTTVEPTTTTLGSAAGTYAVTLTDAVVSGPSYSGAIPNLSFGIVLSGVCDGVGPCTATSEDQSVSAQAQRFFPAGGLDGAVSGAS